MLIVHRPIVHVCTQLFTFISTWYPPSAKGCFPGGGPCRACITIQWPSTASVAEWLRAWDTLTMFEAIQCAGGREFNPRPGQYSRMSFSSDQVTGKVFSPEHAFPSKF